MFRRLRLVSGVITVATLAALPMLMVGSAQGGGGVQIKANEAQQRIDVTIDGKPFTSYIYGSTMKKPALWPIRSSKGTVITRGFPLEPRPRERVDHPHHIGLWFNHGDVNGFDFWNNSDAVNPADAKKFGTIVHRKTGTIKASGNEGELNVEMDWIGGDGAPVLKEQTKFVFRGNGDVWSVDRITTLTALDKPVVFRDNKEGVLGLRVARELEHPADKPEKFTDASGKVTDVPSLDNTGVTGMYTSSEGIKGDKVWGTKGNWTMLSGKVGANPVTVAILDHPKNPGFPTYWHARGYGLFAANMLGHKVFSNGKEELNFSIPAGKSATFRHRVLVFGGEATPQKVETEYKAFTSGS